MKFTVRPYWVLGIFVFGCAGLRITRGFKVAPDDWVLMGGSPTRANQIAASLAPPLVELWQYNSVAGVLATPLVRDSAIIVGTLNGEIQVVNLANGKRLGYITLEGPVVGTPVWDGTNIIVPISTSNASLACIGLDGSERPWSLNLGPIESSPLIYEKFVYVTTLEGRAIAIDKTDGKEVWRFNTDTKEKRKPIRSSPASDGERVFFGCDDGTIYAVERKDGTLKWKRQSLASVFATPIITNGTVVVGSLDGCMYCLDSESGKLLWKFETGSRIYGSAATNGTAVFFGAADGRLFCLDAKTGALTWTVASKSVIDSAPLVTGEVVYVGSLDRTLYSFQVSTGKELWQFPINGRIRVSPVSWGKVLLVVSDDRAVIAFKPQEVL